MAKIEVGQCKDCLFFQRLKKSRTGSCKKISSDAWPHKNRLAGYGRGAVFNELF